MSVDNAARLVAVFADFGFGSLNLKEDDFLEPDIVIEIGREPLKIQILTGIDGVAYAQCMTDRLIVEVDGMSIPVIGLESLSVNKAASPRSKDKIDLEELQNLRDRKRDAR